MLEGLETKAWMPVARSVFQNPRRIAEEEHRLRSRRSRRRRVGQPNRGRHPSEILVADVLTIYLTDVAPHRARENEIKRRVLCARCMVAGQDATMRASVRAAEQVLCPARKTAGCQQSGHSVPP
jgi:hypothetical protein